MAIITTPAAGVSPYQEAAATPVVLKADANGNTVLANPTVTATAADTAATTAANANSNVIVNGQAALNQLIASSRSGVFEGANVTINLEEQNFNTTNQVTSNTNYPSGGTGEIQYNSGSNSFASSAYFTYTNGNVITPGIRTDGYYYANGAAFSGGGGNADLGNWAFTANTQYNLNGGSINNSDLSHGSTAGLVIPANGNSVTPVQLINTYGNITLGTGPSSVITKTWTFASNGNTAMPGNISASGNVTGNYFIGNGSQLTGISSSSSIISNGTSNVSIATSGGPVSVKAGSANAWVFGTDAVLTAPNDSQIVPAGNNFNIYTNGVNGAVQFFTDVTGNNHNWAFDGYGYTNLPFSQGYSNTAVITTVGAGNIMLQAGAGPTQNFVFDTDGALNLTNNGVIRQSGPVNVVATDYAQLQWVDSGNINIPDPNGSGGPLNWAYVESGGFYVETNVNSNAGVSHQLYFNNDGNLQIDYGKLNIFANVSYFGSNAALISPEAGQSMITQALGNTAVASMIWVENVGNALAGNVAAVYANPLPDSGILRFTTGSPSGSQYIWDLDIQGRTLPPLMYTQRGDNPSGTIYGYTLKIGNGGQEAIITTPDGDADGNPNSQRLVINPGKGADTTYGEGGDIYLWAGRGGTAGGTGGDIKIRGGQGMVDGQGGYIRIEGGDSQGAGGGGYITMIGGVGGNSIGGYVQLQGGQGTTGANVTITGGVGTAGPGGAISITGGISANGVSEYGNVLISSGSSTWQFDNSSVLHLPGGTGYISSAANTITMYSDVNETNGMLFYDGGSEVYASGDFAIFTDNAASGNTWRFYGNAVLSLPGEGIIQSLNDTVILQSKNTSTGNIYSARLGTTGGVYLESTEYANGWMYITNNSGNADIDSPSGNINIKPAFGVANGNGKSLNLRGGDADQSDFYTGAGGNINITGGLGAFNDGGGGGPGGDVNISAGLSADPAGVAGNVRINSGSQTWQFINNGNLYVPGQINGDNNGNLVIDGAGYGNGYISLPASSFGGEQVAIVNDFGLGNGIALTTTGGTWHFNNSGNLTLPYGGVIIQTPVSYANLTATAGARAFISDANLAAAGNFGQQVIGGASNTVPVWSDGTNWYIG